MSGKKGQAHYSLELKQQAVRMVLEQGMSYPAVTKALAIRDPGACQGMDACLPA